MPETFFTIRRTGGDMIKDVQGIYIYIYIYIFIYSTKKIFHRKKIEIRFFCVKYGKIVSDIVCNVIIDSLHKINKIGLWYFNWNFESLDVTCSSLPTEVYYAWFQAFVAKKIS